MADETRIPVETLLAAGTRRDRPQVVSVAELVALGFLRVEDIGELRAAGLAFFQLEAAGESVWVEAGAFLRAAQVVADRRADEVVLVSAARAETVTVH